MNNAVILAILAACGAYFMPWLVVVSIGFIVLELQTRHYEANKKEGAFKEFEAEISKLIAEQQYKLEEHKKEMNNLKTSLAMKR
jgi:uncharacterized protein (UPF0212 family)